ncbi:spirocyclase AveC family protein [Mycolicibacterium neoaurum]|uniref:spirocyclase AveC family protein n=1 Tax=Mycolicibacterium neoaurum TaxID=1795 RepID=UPI00248D20EF|nr:spirocyclase AveC family protein [Mycolicibacterium neoaurum]WBP95844.1 spirocyclase AveC family protein [Mycolicibacterium neoaurum]WBS09529.1 spirocyclase AveC family protein [Mycolicibacterium neoaurum]
MVDREAHDTASHRDVAVAVLGAFVGTRRPAFFPGAGAAAADRGRSGAVTVWAAIGVVWLVFIGQVMIRWVTGDDGSFGPAVVLGPDEMATWRLIAMRTIEASSVVIMMAMAWICLVRPWRETGTIGLDGKLYIAATLAAPIDPLINYFHWTFAWNANAINWGSWGHLFPLSNAPHYAEGLVWFIPQYVYLGLGFAMIECAVILTLRRYYPSISNVRAFGVAAILTFLLDITVEYLFILTEIYGYPRTLGALTLFAGSPYQFPIYESLFVTAYATGFTLVRMSAYDDPEGLSFLERGIHRIRPSARFVTSLLACIGFCAVWAALSYFLPWSWLSVNVDSDVTHLLPSYLLPTRS